MCSSVSTLPQLLSQPDENSLRAPDVAESIRVLIPDYFADKRRAAFTELGERIVNVFRGEHDAQVTESVHGGAVVVGKHSRRKKVGNLDLDVE